MVYHESNAVTSDGRVLEVATVGDPAGHTVFFHHGTPGSAAMVSMFADAADATGLFFVTTSRAGYGRSTRHEGRRVASVVDDVRCVLDALARESYVSVGWSGGGPHALACAALDAPRCRAVWSLAGVVPLDVGFDWTDGMGPENLEEFSLALEGGPRYEALIARTGLDFSTADVDNIVALFGGLLSDVDQAALRTTADRAVLANACRQAFANGYFGYLDDDLAFFSDWGFDPRSVAVPAHIWYGDHDLMVPPTHGAWLGANLATARVAHKPAEGHISILSAHRDELVASIVDAFA